MSILAWLAAGVPAAALVVLLVLLALMAAPLELGFRAQGVSPVRGHVALRGLFGLWRTRLALPGTGPARAGRPGAAEGTTQPPSRRRTVAGSGPVRLLRDDPALRRHAVAQLRIAWGSLRWREFRLRLQLGLDDPADTGRLWALLGPLGALRGCLRAADVAIEPDFTEARLAFDAQGRVVLVPLRLLWPLGMLAGCFALALARRRLARGAARAGPAGPQRMK